MVVGLVGAQHHGDAPLCVPCVADQLHERRIQERVSGAEHHGVPLAGPQPRPHAATADPGESSSLNAYMKPWA